ncbi:MAG: glycosyltransferase family 2 protein, partial [Dehalococcoidia bacterium]|nr:glycosyltransferase family 2 protein [Dehalococcoidia bacterium]
VVDNGSSDNSVDLLAARYPEVRIIKLPTNRFFSGAVNAGIRQTERAIVVLLNNDTEAEPQWLASLVEALERNPNAGMAASKMLLFDRRDVLNSAGDFYGIDGIPGNRGVWERDQGQYDESLEVFGACAGAAAYCREMLDAIGLLDEDFVGYCEDVDLNFRAQLAGYRCVFAPAARVYHMLSATGGGTVASFLCGRNFVSVMAKNMPAGLFRRYWPRILMAQLRFVGQSLQHFREPSARARLRGQLAGLGHLPVMLGKRKQVKRLQKVSEDYIESILTR